MVVIGFLAGIWVLLLALILAICRASARADVEEERLLGEQLLAGPRRQSRRRPPRSHRGRSPAADPTALRG